jgi:DNA-binding NtrC family response regulator
MEPLNVVLYQHDAGTARALAANLSEHFPSVYLTRNREEIRPAISRYRASVLVLDVETSGSSELEHLHNEFPGLCIVCTHRLADEGLWTEAVNQGADDMCVPWNTDEVVRSVMRERARRAAA